MKSMKVTAILAALVLTAGLLGGCGGKAEHWSYNYEPEKEVLTLYDNGKAVFNGTEYTYTRNDKFISMTGSDGVTVDHRYENDKDGMIFYDRSVYTRKEGTGKNGIIGEWTHENGHNLFRFGDDGQFSEENIFYGHYRVDESDHSIKLMYVEPMQDTVLYYSVEGDKMTIDYPWPMVRTVNGK
ncbi:MAG: hypothetical protein K6F34_08340 [Lachnospiraceae bacterium]|nr:hypothetical protein [Lachnospiraceae bacterium]